MVDTRPLPEVAGLHELAGHHVEVAGLQTMTEEEGEIDVLAAAVLVHLRKAPEEVH